MKLGFGLYRHMLNREHYDFAVQCGATHAVVHLVDYFGQASQADKDNQPVGNAQRGWGPAGKTPKEAWSTESLLALKTELADAGLKLEAIENFDPAHWHDVLLDGPKRQEQIDWLKQVVRNVGAAGIPTIGYNFSLAGVYGRCASRAIRGNAETVGMSEGDESLSAPIPNGMVWNMVYEKDAPEGVLPEISHAELWDRLEYFLNELVPVAEEAGVRLAAHPDDPPLPRVRRQPRLVYQPDMYQRLLDLVPSKCNGLELCLGTLAEMTEGEVHEACDRYTKQGKVAYIHFRNVVGKVPNYTETFVDDGDIDMFEIVKILKKNRFEGIIIPDHSPKMTCASPWHAGMAFTMGYMKALHRSFSEEA